VNQSETDLGIVNESQLLRLGISAIRKSVNLVDFRDGRVTSALPALATTERTSLEVRLVRQRKWRASFDHRVGNGQPKRSART
jgi:hypothetical protein